MRGFFTILPNPVNWVVRFDETLHQEGSYYCFTSCPICEFCRREGISELMPALFDG